MAIFNSYVNLLEGILFPLLVHFGDFPSPPKKIVMRKSSLLKLRQDVRYDSGLWPRRNWVQTNLGQHLTHLDLGKPYR